MVAHVLPQALVLTHPKATPTELEPYLAQVFAPLRPVVFYGRTAADAPAIGREHAVRSAWKDRAFVNAQ